MNSEKSDRRRKHPVESGLNFGTHMTREQPRIRDQLIQSKADEMPAQRFAAKAKLFVRCLLGQLAPDLLDAVVTHDGAQREQIAVRRCPATLAAASSAVTASVVISSG